MLPTQALDSRITGTKAPTILFYCVTGLTLLILLFLRLSLNFNSAYLDESDYMFVGRHLLNGGDWKTKSYVFSSDIPLYLIGWASNFNGVLSARALSLLPGTLSLFALYGFYRSVLGSRQQAVIAAAIIAIQASHIFISKFATYDVWCLFWFSIALWLLYTPTSGTTGAANPATTSKNTRLRRLIIGSLCFSMAILCKYVVIAYLPAAMVLVWLLGGFRKASIFTLVQTVFVGGYIAWYFADLKLLFNGQLAGHHYNNTTITDILWLLGYFLWPVLILAIAGAVSVFTKIRNIDDRNSLTALSLLILFTLALALPLYHLLTIDRIAVYKHIVYTQLFLAPVAAAGVTLIFRQLPGASGRIAISVSGLLLVAVAYQQLQQIQNAYPNMQGALSKLESVTSKHSKILSENSYLLRNHFYGLVPLNNNLDLEHLVHNYGTQDPAAAIDREQYSLVLLDGRFRPGLAHSIRQNLPAEKYEEIFRESFLTNNIVSGNTHGHITIHQRK